MADVMLFQDTDGGNIRVTNGVAEMTQSPFTAAYLSLFGGNTDDGGTTADDAKQWWGNFDEPELARKYRSRTQHLLRTLPAITSNITRIREAAEADLEWMLEDLAKEIEITVSIPARSRVRIAVKITGRDGTVYEFAFDEAWGVRAA
jgi:phage gp46-like protein